MKYNATPKQRDRHIPGKYSGRYFHYALGWSSLWTDHLQTCSTLSWFSFILAQVTGKQKVFIIANTICKHLWVHL